MPARASNVTPHPTLRIRVSLEGSDPEIWRLLEVSAGLTLADLHAALQIAFGWRESHLHMFTDHEPYARQPDLPRIGRKPRTWGMDDPFGEAPDDQLSERDWTLSRVFDGFDGPLYYEYDFGDGWTHLIELIERIDDDPDAPPALLLRGERRGPPEDSGGIGGYEEKLRVIADPSDPEHDEISGWVQWIAWPGASFDPDDLDVDHVNAELALRFDGEGFGMSGLPTDAFPGTSAGRHPVAPARRSIGTAARAARSASTAADMPAATSAFAAPPLLSESAVIVDLLARLPVPLRGELRRVLRASGLLETVTVDAETAGAMVKPFVWLLRAIGPDGIRLTQAGWLPPAFVRDAVVQLGWEQRLWRVDREKAAYPLAQLRHQATRFGLLRKANGVLHVTAAGRAVTDDPVSLWRMLAGAVVRRADSAAERDILTLLAVKIAADRYPTPPQIETIEDIGKLPVLDPLAFGMDALGWAAADGSMLQSESLRPLARGALRMLSGIGVFESGSESRGATEGGRAFARAMLQAEVE